MKTVAALLSLALLLAQAVLPTLAQRIPLPSAPWYAVVWARGEDRLHWINPDGVIASIKRPALDQEAEDAELRVSFSRDGRFLLQAGIAQPGHEVLGIYDLHAGAFTAQVAAQEADRIELGDGLSSNAGGSRAAVAFAPGEANDGGWQIIIFDLASGAALAMLDDSQLPGAAGAAPVVPRIRVYQTRAQTEQDIIHFQLLPKTGALPATAPAYAWLPGATATTFLQSSPFERTAAELDMNTELEVYTFEDETLQISAFSASGRTDNALASYDAMAAVAAPETLYRDAQRYLGVARWAKGGEWVAVFSESGEQGVAVGWQALSLAEALPDRRLIPLPVDVRAVVGTPDGLLAATTDGRLRHVTSLTRPVGNLLYAPEETALELIQIVFVSAIEETFALSALSLTAAAGT